VLVTLTTERTVLRHWTDGDLEPFAEINDDPEVMEFFPARLSRDESDAMVVRISDEINRTGRGLWALEIDGRFAGYVGTTEVAFDGDLRGRSEIGWRLARWAWGHGYATEAAQAVLADVFSRGNLDAVVSFTTETNIRSRAVMERLGMSRRPDLDFDHPRTPWWWGQRHVVYEMVNPDRSN
jgi:RimJ/RimL family protein N-acetyltransferase